MKNFFFLLITFAPLYLIAMEPETPKLKKKQLIPKLGDDLRGITEKKSTNFSPENTAKPFYFLNTEPDFFLTATSPDKKKIVSLTAPPSENSWLEIRNPSLNTPQKFCIGKLSQENLSFCDEKSLIFCFINNQVVKFFDMKKEKECSELQKTEKLVKYNILTFKSSDLLSPIRMAKLEELEKKANTYQSKDNKVFVTGMLDEKCKKKSFIGLPISKKVVYAVSYSNSVIIMDADPSSDYMRELNSKYFIKTLAHYNEKLIAAGNEYGFIEIWDLEKNSNDPSIRIKQGNDEILSLGFDPTGKYLAVGAQDSFSICNLESQCADCFFKVKKAIRSIFWSEDSLTIKTNDCKVYQANLEVLLTSKKDKFRQN
jgi:WD40 repeat protein